MQLVIDCNVVISGGLAPNGTCQKAITKAFIHYDVVVTDKILEEYRTVASREKFCHYRSILFPLINIFDQWGIKINDQIVPEITLPDKKDLIYVYAAINSGSQYLITGNTKRTFRTSHFLRRIVLKIGSKCSCIAYTLRFFADFCLILHQKLPWCEKPAKDFPEKIYRDVKILTPKHFADKFELT